MKWKTKGDAYLEWSSILLDEDGISIPSAKIILTANRDEELRKFTFVLYYQGHNIRRLDIDDTHSRGNPGSCPEYAGMRIRGNHLHVWNAELGQECVLPIDAKAGDKSHKEWFEYFSGLAGLVYDGEYVTPPFIKSNPRLF